MQAESHAHRARRVRHRGVRRGIEQHQQLALKQERVAEHRARLIARLDGDGNAAPLRMVAVQRHRSSHRIRQAHRLHAAPHSRGRARASARADPRAARSRRRASPTSRAGSSPPTRSSSAIVPMVAMRLLSACASPRTSVSLTTLHASAYERVMSALAGGKRVRFERGVRSSHVRRARRLVATNVS